jgi:pimeloyl-ACP methyl ester carboxylesterase
MRWTHECRIPKERVMRKSLGVTAFLLLVVIAGGQTAYAGTGDYDLFLNRVKLRPGVKCDIHLKVFVNDEEPPLGRTVFAVSGWVHTAQSWDEYAEALFTDPHTRGEIGQLVAIDQPGRGLSSVPTKISFGELLVDDYVTAILAVLDRLPAHGIRPQEMVGFSQGGLVIPMVQQRLLDGGSSLFDEYGVVRAVLLAPSAPAPIDEGCTCDPDLGEGCPLVAFLKTEGPEYDVLGLHYDIPAWLHPSLFYSNWEGVVSPDAPSPQEIEARGWRAPGPLFAAMQMTGYTGYLYDGQPYFPIPEVSPGIFGLQSGTLLHVVGFEDDTMCVAPIVEEAFHYLVGSPVQSTYTLVEAVGQVHDRVHCLPMSNPSAIIKAMRKNGALVW